MSGASRARESDHGLAGGHPEHENCLAARNGDPDGGACAAPGLAQVEKSK